MAQLVKVMFRNPVQGVWHARVEDSTGRTVTKEGGTILVYGRPKGESEERELAAFPLDAISSVTFGDNQ